MKKLGSYCKCSPEVQSTQSITWKKTRVVMQAKIMLLKSKKTIDISDNIPL